MKTERGLLARLACAWILLLAFVLPAHAQQDECSKCHSELQKKAFVHEPVTKGCSSCHAQLDASVEPHKSGSKFRGGLASETTALCVTCHKKELLEGKVTHAPVAAGNCLDCHDPHASDHLGLLRKEPATLCLDCHADVKKRPHVIVGFSRNGHPLGDEKRPNEIVDPLRPGKKFYCVACHEPHRSELPRLARFEKGMVSCQACHKK